MVELFHIFIQVIFSDTFFECHWKLDCQIIDKQPPLPKVFCWRSLCHVRNKTLVFCPAKLVMCSWESFAIHFHHGFIAHEINTTMILNGIHKQVCHCGPYDIFYLFHNFPYVRISHIFYDHTDCPGSPYVNQLLSNKLAIFTEAIVLQ